VKLTSSISFVLIIGGLFVFVVADPTESCTCDGRTRTPVEAMDVADYVLSGQVVSSQRPGLSYYIVSGDTAWYRAKHHIRFQFQVNTVWKGAIEDTVDIYSRMQRTACGFNFEIGEHYLVYGYVVKSITGADPSAHLADWPEGGAFSYRAAGICSRTRPVEIADDDIFQLPDPIWTRSED
jgi:hypothetical protein